MNRKALFAIIAAGLFGLAIGAFAIVALRPSLIGGAITEAMVRDTLRAHPEIVLEALQLLQKAQGDSERQQQRAAIRANRDALFNDPNSFVAGNPQGDVTLVEFFDYRCPYCRKAMTTVAALIERDQGLRVLYKEYPILGPQSMVAARLAIAARKDPRYPALHEALMTAPGPLDEAGVLTIAAGLGFDRAAMAAAMKAPEVDAVIAANQKLARTLAIAGTPAFILGDVLVPGAVSLEELRRLVAEARANGGDRANPG